MIESEAIVSPELLNFRLRLKCGFEQIDDVFEGCMLDAQTHLSEKGINAYLKGASVVCMIGRGVEPVLQYLEVIPELAGRVGEEVG